MHDVGVDLAWGERGRTGLALLDGDGRLVEIATGRCDEEVLGRLGRWTAGPCLVAVDAPIVVRNPSGSRACERLVGRYFGRFHASCHPSNLSLPAFAAGSRAHRLVRALDLELAAGAARRAIEVYPHPALVIFFDLPVILAYKHKPGRDLAGLRSQTLRLLDLIESLRERPIGLDVTGCAQWSAIRDTVRGASRKADLRRVEDGIDAVVCAYIARYARLAPEHVRTLGEVADGAIVVPTTPELAARIDADARAAAGSDMATRPDAAPGRQDAARRAARPARHP